MELERPGPLSHALATGLLVPQQMHRGPSPGRATSVSLLSGMWPTGKVQFGCLLCQGTTESSFFQSTDFCKYV